MVLPSYGGLVGVGCGLKGGPGSFPAQNRRGDGGNGRSSLSLLQVACALREDGVVPTPEAATRGVLQRRTQDDGLDRPTSALDGRKATLLPARRNRSWFFFLEADVERDAHRRFSNGRSSTSTRDSQRAARQVVTSPATAHAFGRRGLRRGVTGSAEIHAFDLSGPDVTMKMIMGRSECDSTGSAYIVQDPRGNLLLICRICEDYDLLPDHGAPVFWKTGKIDMYEVDVVASNLKEINRLSAHVLFLGHNQSLCLSAKEYPALKENHAYFTDDSFFWTKGLKNNYRDMGVLNLDDNRREDLVFPQRCSNFPAPVWITPDLRKMKLASGAA